MPPPLSSSPTIVRAAAGALALLTAAYCLSRVARHYSSSDDSNNTNHSDANRHKNKDDDDIDFADPKEAHFLIYLNNLEKTTGAALQQTIQELEALVLAAQTANANAKKRKQQAAAAAAEEQQTPQENEKGEEEGSGGVADARTHEGDRVKRDERCHYLAKRADELLTQYLCKLDGVPAKTEDLKTQRKKLVMQVSAMGKTIQGLVKQYQVATVAAGTI